LKLISPFDVFYISEQHQYTKFDKIRQYVYKYPKLSHLFINYFFTKQGIQFFAKKDWLYLTISQPISKT